MLQFSWSILHIYIYIYICYLPACTSETYKNILQMSHKRREAESCRMFLRPEEYVFFVQTDKNSINILIIQLCCVICSSCVIWSNCVIKKMIFTWYSIVQGSSIWQLTQEHPAVESDMKLVFAIVKHPVTNAVRVFSMFS